MVEETGSIMVGAVAEEGMQLEIIPLANYVVSIYYWYCFDENFMPQNTSSAQPSPADNSNRKHSRHYAEFPGYGYDGYHKSNISLHSRILSPLRAGNSIGSLTRLLPTT